MGLKKNDNCEIQGLGLQIGLNLWPTVLFNDCSKLQWCGTGASWPIKPWPL